jgi:peptide/nickel transport system permease protein
MPFLFGAVLLLVILFAAVAAPVLSHYDPYKVQLTQRLLPPAFSASEKARPEHLLGTDQVGRDLLTRLMLGARWSLWIASAASLSAAALGTALGLLAGYVGRRFESFIMGVADVQLSVPPMLLAIAVVAAMGPGVRNLILVLAITGWVVYARTARAQVLAVREQEFIQAAEASGASQARILFRHLLPNILTPLIIIFSQQVGFMILMEAALSFLGLGIQPPEPSWGGMISEARLYLPVAPWAVLIPGAALALAVMAVNLLGDGLRDALDPRTRM